MIRPKKDTEDLLLSKTENDEKIFKETHTKLQETLKT